MKSIFLLLSPVQTSSSKEVVVVEGSRVFSKVVTVVDVLVSLVEINSSSLEPIEQDTKIKIEIIKMILIPHIQILIN